MQTTNPPKADRRQRFNITATLLKGVKGDNVKL